MTYFFLNRLMRLILCTFILVSSGFSTEEERDLLSPKDATHLSLKKSSSPLTLEDLNIEIKEKKRQLQALKQQQVDFLVRQVQAPPQDVSNVFTSQMFSLKSEDEGPLSLEDLTRAYQQMTKQLQIQLAQNEALTQALAELSSLREDIHSLKHPPQRQHDQPAPPMTPFLLGKLTPTTGAFILSTLAFYKTYGTVTWLIKFVPAFIAPPLWGPLGISLTVAGVTYTGTIIGFKIL